MEISINKNICGKVGCYYENIQKVVNVKKNIVVNYVNYVYVNK